VEEDWDYQWFYAKNAWDYDVVVRDKGLSSGTLNATSAMPAKLSVNVDWGHYRLEVFDAATGTASSVRFFAGWWAKPGTTTTPDRMQVVADKDLYQPGDQAEVRLAAPFAGQALVTIATDACWRVDWSMCGRRRQHQGAVDAAGAQVPISW